MSDLQRAIEDAIIFHELQLRSMQDSIDKDFAPSAKRWYRDAKGYTQTALSALREKAERERGCAYCVIGKRSPDAEYCSNCGRKLTPRIPELANESEKVNHEPKLASETAEICTLRCDYCGKYAKESDLTTEYTKDKYLICRRCKENA
jgi:hypothetical protein